MNELQEEIDAINFAPGDEIVLTLLVGWRTFLKIIVPMLPIAVLCAIPPAMIITAIPIDEIVERMNLNLAMALRMQLAIEGAITAPFGLLVSLVAMVSAVRAMAQNHLGVWANVMTAMRRMLPMIGTMLLLCAIAFVLMLGIGVLVGIFSTLPEPISLLGAFLLVMAVLAAAVVLGVKLAFTWGSVVVGGNFGVGAFTESMRLVRGKWLQTLAVLIIIGLCGAVMQAPAVLSGVWEGVVMSLTDNFVILSVADAVTIALGFIAGLFGSSAWTAFYLLRRKQCEPQASGSPLDDVQPQDDTVQPSDFRQ